MPALISQVAASLRRAGCQRVVAAFSGGLDSCVLATLLAEVCPDEGWSFELAYFNHRLRGEESDREERFCRGFAEKLGVPLHVGSWSDPRPSEADARRARYRWLLEVAESGGFQGVATAHHRRDQAETVLIRLVRGSGLRGLRAMAERSLLPGSESVLLLRPMLDVSRRALQEFAGRRGFEWFEDSSNQSDRFLRNRIRRQLLPLFEELRPGAERRLASLAKAARAETSALDQVARRAAKLVESGVGWAFLPRKAWIRVPGLARRLILDAVSGMHSAVPPDADSGANVAGRLPGHDVPPDPKPGTLDRLLDSMRDNQPRQRRFALTGVVDAVVLATGVVLLDRSMWPALGTGLQDKLHAEDPEVEQRLDVRVFWSDPIPGGSAASETDATRSAANALTPGPSPARGRGVPFQDSSKLTSRVPLLPPAGEGPGMRAVEANEIPLATPSIRAGFAATGDPGSPSGAVAAGSAGQEVSDASGRERRERNVNEKNPPTNQGHDALRASIREENLGAASRVRTEPVCEALRAPLLPENLPSAPRRLWVKTRGHGERLGAAGPALKRLFIDRKLPRFMRDRYPIVGDDDGPLLVPGLWLRPGSDTPQVSFGPTWPRPLLPSEPNPGAPKTVEPWSSLPARGPDASPEARQERPPDRGRRNDGALPRPRLET